MFRCLSRAFAPLIFVFPHSAVAQDFAGIYRPNYAFARDWSCNAGDLGSDGGSVGIVDGKMIGVENQCTLSNPTPVPGNANATRYDEECWGEGTQYTATIEIEKTPVGILFRQNDEPGVEWRLCDAQAVETAAITEPAATDAPDAEIPSVWSVETRPKAFETGDDYFFSVTGDPQFCRNPSETVEDRTKLRIQCNNDAPVVFIELNTCDLGGRSSEPVAVEYRFDEGDIKTVNFGPLPDQDTTHQLGLWDPADAVPFLQAIRGAQSLTLAYAVKGQVSRFAMRFDIGGFSQHWDDLGRSCPGLLSTAPVEPAPVETVAPDDQTGGGQAGEAALGLSRNDRREAQQRLTLIGYDTHGVDGVFGPATRRAIKLWQGGTGLVANGYLSAQSLKLLKSQSKAAWAAWQTKPKRYYGSDGCLRRANGRIIRGRTVRCDIRALGQ